MQQTIQHIFALHLHACSQALPWYASKSTHQVKLFTLTILPQQMTLNRQADARIQRFGADTTLHPAPVHPHAGLLTQVQTFA